jgi:hypothetical protein
VLRKVEGRVIGAAQAGRGCGIGRIGTCFAENNAPGTSSGEREMRKWLFPFVAVAALFFLGVGAEKADAQVVVVRIGGGYPGYWGGYPRYWGGYPGYWGGYYPRYRYWGGYPAYWGGYYPRYRYWGGYPGYWGGYRRGVSVVVGRGGWGWGGPYAGFGYGGWRGGRWWR